MPRTKSIKLDNLARELGLSANTVSKALRGLPGMSEETRLAVREHALKRGYITNQRTIDPTEGNSDFSGKPAFRFLFIAAAPEQMHHSNIHYLLLSGIQERLAEIGQSVNVLFLPAEEDPEEQFDAWLDQNQVRSSDGIFIPPNISMNWSKILHALKVPRILINFPPTGCKLDSVVWDVYDAAKDAVSHLIEKGHKRILYVGDIYSERGYKLRWQGFLDAMQEAELAVNPSDHLLKWLPQEELIVEFLEKHRRFQPTALICASHLDLTWLYYAYGTLQLQIPSDCSLVSLAATPLMPDLARPLFKIKESGYRAADRMLLRNAKPEQPYEHIRLVSDFWEGKTITAIETSK